MFRVIVFTLISVCGYTLCGQIGSVQLDRPFYFDGDEISYSYDGSQAIVVEIYSEAGLIDQHVALSSSTSGSILLPEDISTQWVLFRAYQWKEDATIHIIEQRFIPIYGSDVQLKPDDNIAEINGSDGGNEYDSGSIVEVDNISGSDTWIMSQVYADATAAIYRDYPSASSIYQSPIDSNEDYLAVAIPSDHGTGLHGLFNLQSGKTSFGRVKGAGNILMVPLSKDPKPQMSSWSMITVPSIGSVIASMPSFLSSDIVSDLPVWPNDTPSMISNMGAIYSDYMELRQINLVLQSDQMKQSLIEPLANVEPDRSYRVEDFVRFKTTKEFFEEVVSASKIIKDNGQLDVRLLANNKKYATSAPLTIFNGQICNDIRQILSTKIDKVSVYFKTQRLLEFFGIAGRNGIMIIEAPAGKICANTSISLDNEVNSSDRSPLLFKHILDSAQSLDQMNRYRFNELKGSFIKVSIDNNGNVQKGNEVYHAAGKNLK